MTIAAIVAGRDRLGIFLLVSIYLFSAASCSEKKRQQSQAQLSKHFDALLRNPVSLTDIESGSKAIPEWHRIIILAPYQREETFASVAHSRRGLVHELYDISSSLEQWTLVTLDEDDRILTRHAVAWKSKPDYVIKVLLRSP